jgi:NADPH-dependent 2,4-dienoyl-CoA reductase/sulfur reductase-like enzyme/nitrite reductase/ring-hydroxylating ferredoxin subunit
MEMENGEWKKAIEEAKLAESVPTPVEVDGAKILLVKAEGKIYACGNECSHYHAPLTDGLLAGHVVTCPSHNARFDIRDGRMLAAPGLNDLPTYEVKLDNGAVYVRQATKGAIPMPEGEDKRTFLIVGAGAAGNAAAEVLRREGFCGRIVMVTAEAVGPYDRTMLSKDYLSGEAPAKWLPLRGEKFYNRLNIEVLTKRRVVALDPKSRTVTFEGGDTLQADAILLATGGVPRRLPVPGADLDGVFLLRSQADAEALIAAAESAAESGGGAVIIGASFIGLEVAGALRARGLEVHVAAPEEIPLARVFGDDIGRRIKERHAENGIRFHLGRTAKEIRGSGKVDQVVLDDGATLPAAIVVVGVGIHPAVDYLEGSGLARDGAVPVNELLETAAEGIYAAGDIALAPDPLGGGPRRIEHWVEAERQGQHAARAMLGSKEPYREVPFFWSRQLGKSLRYIGFAREFDRVIVRGDVARDDFVAGFYHSGTLKAAASIGHTRELIRLGQILQAGGTVSPEQLGDPKFDLVRVGL